ncbi:hypothetical protein CTAYLR_008588 [Chrysophaeum taylorii]|uniref:adrenodoxin-NADP(+) reductase n=1 Tax=Chrysophaeum taylorii TaxID=2483200 RepID=A0AAD7UM59_9STRA|nr:hypothetical protein CTAYLR_008588 [Chrysophaeum taylorii]
MFEKWPTPFGLVRFGVAPDHPEVKAVTSDFHKVAENIKFYGNTEVGRDVSLDALRDAYDGVVIACGASVERKLRIPGENLEGVFHARKFVGWYNGEPLQNVEMPQNPDVVIIGHGNVALDCARVLKTDLSNTDASRSAVPKLGTANRVSVVGRRGATQAAFTIKELREIAPITGLDRSEFGDTEASLRELEISKPKKRKRELLESLQGSEIRLRFLLKPVEFRGKGRVESVLFEKCELEGEPGRQIAVGAGTFEEIPANLVLCAIGYLSNVPGFGIVPRLDHVGGRVVGHPRLYCAGWCKRGPSGIVGTNVADAKETVASILEDLEGGGNDTTPAKFIQLPASSTTWDDWLRIDRHERDLGSEIGAPRVKLVDISDMLRVARHT